LRPALLDPILQLSSSAQSCGAASGPACASPSALPQISLAADPWDLHPSLAACSCPPALPPAWLAPRLRPCLDLVSSSRLLQLIRPEPATSRRLSILRPPSRLGSGLRPSELAFRPAPFPWPFGVALSSDSRPLPWASLSGWVSTQGLRPSLPLNPPAAFQLRRSTKGSRPSSPAFPSGQPSGLPLSGVRLSPLRLRCEAALWHAFDPRSQLTRVRCSVWPSVPVSRTRVPFPGPPAIGLRLVPPQTAPALRPSPLAAANSLRPVDHRALDPHRACALLDPPSRLLPRAFGLRLAPVGNRPPGPASASPACRLPACACIQLSGLPFPDGCSRELPSFRCLPDRSRNFGLRLRLLPGPSGLAFRFRTSCAWLAPCTLGPSVQLAFASTFRLPPSGFRSGPAAGSIGYLNSRLAPAVPPTGPFRIQPTRYRVRGTAVPPSTCVSRQCLAGRALRHARRVRPPGPRRAGFPEGYPDMKFSSGLLRRDRPCGRPLTTAILIWRPSRDLSG